jgi:hypothetical protein
VQHVLGRGLELELQLKEIAPGLQQGEAQGREVKQRQ